MQLGPLSAPQNIEDAKPWLDHLLAEGKSYEQVAEFLQELLNSADHAYFNTDTPLMPDSVYDFLRDQLFYLNSADVGPVRVPGPGSVGAPIPVTDDRKVTLPFWMGSLDKVRDQKALKNWIQKPIVKAASQFVVTDKLDGVSALVIYHPHNKVPRMFTRGDGFVGQDVSDLISYLSSDDCMLPASPQGVQAIRGELIISRSDFARLASMQPHLANARNTVSGLVNRKVPDPHTSSVTQFIAYEVLEPSGLSPQEQLGVLQANGFKTPWSTVVTDVHQIQNVAFLRDLFVSRKSSSLFEVDGLVIQCDAPGLLPVPGSNPSYAVAFKSLDIQEHAQTTVLHVEWSISKDGKLKPTVHFQPVHLSGVTIQRASGHNAAFIDASKIGPGCVIEVTRSGDVIPYILRVVSPAPNGAQMPSPHEFGQWSWSSKEIVLDDYLNNKDVQLRCLAEFFKGIGAKGVADKTISAVFSAGYTTVRDILRLTPADLIKIPGFEKTKANTFCSSIRQALQGASLVTLMSSSNAFGSGFGERKLNLILAELSKLPGFPPIHEFIYCSPDLPNEHDLTNIPGVSVKTAEAFNRGLVEFRNFVKLQGLQQSQAADNPTTMKPDILLKGSGNPTTTWLASLFSGKNVVFTGVRCKQLESLIAEVGGEVKSGVSKSTNILIYAEPTGNKFSKAAQLETGSIKLIAWSSLCMEAAKQGLHL